MCDIFYNLALNVAKAFDFTYRQDEEDGIRTYIDMVKNDMQGLTFGDAIND